MKTCITSLFLLLLSFTSMAQENHPSSFRMLHSLHEADKSVSAKLLFQGKEGRAMALQILKNSLLKEHTTPVPALLICVTGEVIYEDEKGRKQPLTAGQTYAIEPMVKHWVKALADSQLVLLK